MELKKWTLIPFSLEPRFLIDLLSRETRNRAVRSKATTWTRFVKDGIESVDLAFNSRMLAVYNLSDMGEIVSAMIKHMYQQIENPALRDRKFVYDGVIHMDIDFHRLTLGLPNVDRSRQRKTGVIFRMSTLIDKRPQHTSATPFLASLRRPTLYQTHFGTNGSEQTGLPSWKVAWSYVENFSSYSHSKSIKFSVDFSGISKRSSNCNTYRNEAFKDIFSCRGKSL